MRVAIAHPDLGIGGAERLIVDAAVGLIQAGHDVVVYTSHHDHQHAFVETINGTVPVVVYGDFFPTNVAGRGKIVFATMRALYLAGRMLFRYPYPDVILFDQISAYACLLRLMAVPLIFYCHFPDQLLSSRTSLLKRCYRIPFDLFEQATTSLADCILVNSSFTRTVFAETFPLIRRIPDVLYPSINFSSYDRPSLRRDSDPRLPPKQFDDSRAVIFVSINRFERKKGIELAINAFAHLHGQVQSKPIKLVVAGGYDDRVVENVEYELELKDLVGRRSLAVSNFPDMVGDVIFLRSFDDDQRAYLLRRSAAVIYTPQNEHFGIVPIEAMYSSRPVIAANSGGPLESILHGKTGFLCDPVPAAFADAMSSIVHDPESTSSMGIAGRQHVISRFSLDAFSRRLLDVIANTAPSDDERDRVFPLQYPVVIIILVLFFVLYTTSHS